MSIEEKARAYDEALERAKELLLGNEHSNTIRSYFEHIFPELKESEDERIRKALAKTIKESPVIGVGEFSKNDMLAYLEKQKDLFESGRGLYYYDGEKTIYCGYPATEENPYDFAMSQQEKQKEQKLVEWSEEDEKNMATLFEIINCYQRFYDGGVIVSAVNRREFLAGMTELSNWLKSLRPQPKQEWSEKDGKLLRLIISILENKLPGKFYRSDEMESGVYVEELVDFLENLRPSHKLSEDQICTLGRICSNLHLRASDDAPKLDDIIELLKQK